MVRLSDESILAHYTERDGVQVDDQICQQVVVLQPVDRVILLDGFFYLLPRQHTVTVPAARFICNPKVVKKWSSMGVCHSNRARQKCT